MSENHDAARPAVKTAVGPAPDDWGPGRAPDPLSRHRSGTIGTRVSRVDGPLKVRGAATFAAEFRFDGMVYAALAFSTVPKGRITELDTAAAEGAPGVVLVMTYRNAPKITPLPEWYTEGKAVAGDTLPVMQDDRIHWNGQPIAVVLADTQEQADHAASLIRAGYEPEPAVTSFEQAKAAGRHPTFHYGRPLKTEISDAEAALAAAPVKVDEIYRTPFQNHNAIEPHAVTLAWDGDELVVHDASQAVVHTAWSLGYAFGLRQDQVHVSSPYVGGGFGGKSLWSHHILAAAAAKLAGRPVRAALTREGVYRVVGGRTKTEQRVAIGARPDGGFDALVHTGVVAMGRHNTMPPEPFITSTGSLYAARSFTLEVEAAHMDMLANTFMRAPGEAVGSFGLECAIDELADRLGMDPIELRVRNEPERNPTSGLPFSSRHLLEAYRVGAERFGWTERSPRPGTRSEGEWRVGMGVATASHPYIRLPGGEARITLTADGRVIIDVAAHEMGMGTETTTAIVAAERLGLDLDQVTVRQGDSRLPGLIMAGGAQQTAVIGGAVSAAHRALLAVLIELAGHDSPLAGLRPEEVGCVNGGLHKLEDPSRFESYTDILARAGRGEVSVEASGPPPLELTHWSMRSYGAMFCEARVNAVTGETRISRFLGSFDCGRIMNAKTAASQFRGGIIMGLGLALMEETHLDERHGRIMNPNLAEYHVPVHMDVPEIEVMWTDIPDPHSPMGAHGVGEIGITGVGAAVANAVYNATGRRVRDLPITLDKLL
ncbi:xanthine dehydrogenase family protein molybdopterin-binding subunit [Actinoallomurus soli]|uniref:xanthine dehydrogenase family protein molybdopterin-binding subunit n=1 Tax=Actinoallomurus soli TaxID=2952535 RepID=UPI002092824D|nr:xanthine dehydrogenase family protein molybdopterin-binding subunit [Actinoallomurus soli]MCO5972631.1 xanthine dehydrogenase family protein molybdopterin-binding subunit [Actinoallomurus soli]